MVPEIFPVYHIFRAIFQDMHCMHATLQDSAAEAWAVSMDRADGNSFT